MRLKGISGLMVAIFLTLIAVGLAFAFLVFGRSTQETFEKEVGGGVEGQISSLQSGLAIANVNANNVTVKNTGRTNLDVSKIDVLLDGKKASTSATAATIVPGGTAVLTLTGFVPGVHAVRVTGPGGVGDEGDFGVAPSGVVALWDFEDEDANPDDSVGTNNGRLNGSTVLLLHFDEGAGTKAYDSTNYKNDGTFVNNALWGAGVSGNGVKLDGVAASITVPNSPSVNNIGLFTTEAWFRWDAQGVSQVLVTKSDAHLYISGANVLSSYFGGSPCASGVSISRGAWYHSAVTFDGTNVRIYVNGDLKATCARTGNTGTANLFVGQNGIGGQFFNGTIDEVAIHGRALSADEVGSHYDAKRALFSEYVKGFAGTAVRFDGVNDDVEVPKSAALDPGAQVSLETWIKSDPSNPMNTCCQGLVSTDFYNIGVSTGGVYFAISSNSGASYPFTGTVAVSSGVWHHIVGTYDGTAVRLYVDGAQAASAPASGAVSPMMANSFLTVASEDGRTACGAQCIGVRYFRGDVQYAAVYNRALSAQEIKSIYDASTA
ncbi:MAG: LamG domain-containing protein [Candidatus Aenigmatarchaeota archaeon]|nr:MAG: LamG domain-containing protein [Candidatus Aenigmarchaeota archaeon]